MTPNYGLAFNCWDGARGFCW